MSWLYLVPTFCNSTQKMKIRQFCPYWYNKNTLTGPANCTKTTRDHAHQSLCAKSRKTNDVMSRKWPKTLIWAIFWRFWGQISPNCKFFWKIGFISFNTNFRPKPKKIRRAAFEKNIKVSHFGLVWRPSREYLQTKNFFQKSGSVKNFFQKSDFSTFIIP